jgi:hypothetical protein
MHLYRSSHVTVVVPAYYQDGFPDSESPLSHHFKFLPLAGRRDSDYRSAGPGGRSPSPGLRVRVTGTGASDCQPDSESESSLRALRRSGCQWRLSHSRWHGGGGATGPARPFQCQPVLAGNGSLPVRLVLVR